MSHSIRALERRLEAVEQALDMKTVEGRAASARLDGLTIQMNRVVGLVNDMTEGTARFFRQLGATVARAQQSEASLVTPAGAPIDLGAMRQRLSEAQGQDDASGAS